MPAALARLAAISALALACEAPSIKHPPLDERAAAETAEIVKSAPPETRHLVAANGLRDLERERMDPKVLDALDAFANAPADMRAVKLGSALDSTGARAGWRQVCTGSFEDTYAKFVRVESAEGLVILRGACDAARFEQLGVSPSAKVSAYAVFIALIAYGSIERGAPVSDAERALLSALAATPATW